MINVVLIGSGNVALHLCKAFEKTTKINIIQRFSRRLSNNAYFPVHIPVTNDISTLKKADVYFIAISDQAIAKLSKQLTFKSGLVVHTSGSMPLHTLECNANKGVFYPLQTFSLHKEIDFKNIPLALETEHKADYKLLEHIAKQISNYTYAVNSEQRNKLHIAAVFANNFSNHMYYLASKICKDHHIDFEILHPLIIESANKISQIPPFEAQTGPAKRKDTLVIENHIEQLEGISKEIYTLVTQSILNTYQSEEENG